MFNLEIILAENKPKFFFVFFFIRVEKNPHRRKIFDGGIWSRGELVSKIVHCSSSFWQSTKFQWTFLKYFAMQSRRLLSARLICNVLFRRNKWMICRNFFSFWRVVSSATTDEWRISTKLGMRNGVVWVIVNHRIYYMNAKHFGVAIPKYSRHNWGRRPLCLWVKI